MKKEYITPEAEPTVIVGGDVLTASPGTETPILPEEDGTWVW